MSCKPRWLAFLLPFTLLLAAPCALGQSPLPTLDDVLSESECGWQTDLEPAPTDQVTIGFDFDPGANALACHGQVTCPDPQSCAGWSVFTNCGSTFCSWDPFCETKGYSGGVTAFRERFRYCTLNDGSSCRENEVYGYLASCGCSGGEL